MDEYKLKRNIWLRRNLSIRMATEETKQPPVFSDDTKNRDNVRKEIERLVTEGLKVEDAAKIIAQEETVKKQFKYLTQHGIILEEIFADWYKQYMKNKDRNVPLGPLGR